MFLSVRLSGTSQCSTETAKCRIMQRVTHDSPGTLVLWCRKSRQNSNRVTQMESANTGAVAENWRLLMRSVVNLAWLQVYHTERPPYLFAARLPWCSMSRGFVTNSWSLSNSTSDPIPNITNKTYVNAILQCPSVLAIHHHLQAFSQYFAFSMSSVAAEKLLQVPILTAYFGFLHLATY